MISCHRKKIETKYFPSEDQLFEMAVQRTADFFLLILLLLLDDLITLHFFCPGTLSTDYNGLELTRVHLPLPPAYWD